jgi:hypothetical protein
MNCGREQWIVVRNKELFALFRVYGFLAAVLRPYRRAIRLGGTMEAMIGILYIQEE